MKVLGIGEIVLDKIYTISGEVSHGQKCQSHDSLLSIGGPVPSALKLLNNLGCETTIIGSIGKGPIGRFVKEQFDLHGINHNLILDKYTKVNAVIVEELTGTRTIIKDKVHNKPIKEISISLIKEADIIIFDRTEKDIFDFVLYNKREDTKIIIDPSSENSQEIFNMVKKSYVPIFPIETIYKLSLENDFTKNVEKLYNMMGKNIIITDGGNGAYTYDGKNLRNYEALKICPLDTNGAGDIFRGGFCYGLLNNWNLEDCIIFANKVAGLQCLKKGNLTAVSNLEEINNFNF